MSATILDTGPPRRSASRFTRPGEREKHQASNQTSYCRTDTLNGRHQQLSPLAAVRCRQRRRS